jgi:hypothetical protein
MKMERGYKNQSDQMATFDEYQGDEILLTDSAIAA